MGEEKKFKLPKYLKLAKGSMWFDSEGENCSGVKLFVPGASFVGRGKVGAPAEDKFKNQNYVNFGFVEKELPWYFETSTIPPNKLSRIIVAYNSGILVKADPEKDKVHPVEHEPVKDFKSNKDGDLVFIGKNKAMYKLLQNSKDTALKEFIRNAPATETSRNDLLDLYDYEQKGYNNLARCRGEILDMIRAKLNQFGPGLSPIRMNDE
jgi:hypothetical protein